MAWKVLVSCLFQTSNLKLVFISVLQPLILSLPHLERLPDGVRLESEDSN